MPGGLRPDCFKKSQHLKEDLREHRKTRASYPESRGPAHFQMQSETFNDPVVNSTTMCMANITKNR